MTKEELIAFEEKVAQLWQEGKLDCPVHLCGGNENELIAIFKEVRPIDYVFCSHRNHYHALLHGVGADCLMQELLGGRDAVCQGRARSMGFISHAHRFYSSAIVGGLCAMATGVAWSLKRERENDPLYGDEVDTRPRVWCFVGDGALDGGHFWESLHYAEGWNLPIQFVIEDNDRATKTPWVDRNGPGVNRFAWGSKRVWHYKYLPTSVHVGTGKYVQF